LRHDLHVPGFAFGLRPITLDDAEFIVQLRSDPERTRYLYPIVATVEAQTAHLKEYLEREDDYHFVVERQPGNTREGLVGIYNLNLEERSAEWGRWILRPGSLAAVESALRTYEAAFEHLQLEKVCSHTLVENRSVVSFHDHCGLKRLAIRPDYYSFRGRSYDVVEHVLQRRDWPQVRQLLELLARTIARQLECG